jgi:hypothetical protein
MYSGKNFKFKVSTSSSSTTGSEDVPETTDRDAGYVPACSEQLETNLFLVLVE